MILGAAKQGTRDGYEGREKAFRTGVMCCAGCCTFSLPLSIGRWVSLACHNRCASRWSGFRLRFGVRCRDAGAATGSNGTRSVVDGEGERANGKRDAGERGAATDFLEFEPDFGEATRGPTNRSLARGTTRFTRRRFSCLPESTRAARPRLSSAFLRRRSPRRLAPKSTPLPVGERKKLFSSTRRRSARSARVRDSRHEHRFPERIVHSRSSINVQRPFSEPIASASPSRPRLLLTLFSSQTAAHFAPAFDRSNRRGESHRASFSPSMRSLAAIRGRPSLAARHSNKANRKTRLANLGECSPPITKTRPAYLRAKNKNAADDDNEAYKKEARTQRSFAVCFRLPAAFAFLQLRTTAWKAVVPDSNFARSFVPWWFRSAKCKCRAIGVYLGVISHHRARPLQTPRGSSIAPGP